MEIDQGDQGIDEQILDILSRSHLSLVFGIRRADLANLAQVWPEADPEVRRFAAAIAAAIPPSLEESCGDFLSPEMFHLSAMDASQSLRGVYPDNKLHELFLTTPPIADAVYHSSAFTQGLIRLGKEIPLTLKTV